MTAPNTKETIASILKGSFRRFGMGVLRDFLKVGSVFGIVFILMMLHLTHTFEIPIFTWLFTSAQRNIIVEVPVNEKNESYSSDDEQIVPNLLP